jgi:hypothetical protein
MISNESETTSRSLDRRTFLAVSTQAVAGALAVTQFAPVSALEPAAAAAETPKSVPLQYTPRYRPLQIDHERARAEFADLIKAIPEAERWKSPFPPEAKNGWQALKEAEAKRVSLETFIKDPDPAKKETELDRLELAGEERIPWPAEEDWAVLQRWVAANREYANAIEQIITESDYLSPFAEQELRYYEEPYEVGELQTISNDMIFLRRWTLCLIRSEDWSKAKQSLAAMRTLVQKNAGTKGFVVHGMTRSALVSVTFDSAMRMLQHPRMTLKLGEPIWKFISGLREIQPTLEFEQRFEFQSYYPNVLAQIPVLKNVRDQVPALSLAGQLDEPGADVVFAERKPQDLDEYINPAKMLDLSVDAGLLRVVPCLLDHPKPFDKAKTVAWGWQAVKAFLAEYRRHEHPYRTLNWRSEEYFAEYDRLNNLDKVYMNELTAALENLNEKLPKVPPLTDDTVAELRRSFSKQENPLGRLFVAYQLRQSSLAMYTSITQERHDTSELCAACWIFEQRHQRRPKKLEELVEERLVKQIPTSSRSGEPFGYDAKRGLIWRRGEEGTPDGKVPKAELPDGLSAAEIARDYYPSLGIYPLIGAS